MALHCERCGQENAKDARFCRHCGAQIAALGTDPTLAVDPLIGQMVLGRYEVTALIGEGGMGRVYAAAQRVGTTTRKVAVKTLLAQLGADPQLVKRFYREAETIVRLTHPNTIQFFDFGELPDRTLVIVMEFIEGRSLADALLQGPLAPARFDAILTQICGALFEAHQLGIVHRDLKPDNILLTDRGGRTDFVKVLDFGIAKISNVEEDKPQATKLTQQGMMVGTPPYMSPEQFSGEHVDARSDIYSLGVIAYEMLTGRLPFAAKTPWEWASKHMTAEPEPLRVDAQTGISERRAWAIGRALSKSPADRQRDVQEFLADLTGTGTFSSAATPTPTASLPATAAAPTPIQTSRTEPGTGDVPVPVRKGPWIWVAGLAAALLVVSGGLWWAGRSTTPPAPPPVAAWAVPASPPVAPLPESPVAATPTALGAIVPAPPEPTSADSADAKSARTADRPHGEHRARSDRMRTAEQDRKPSSQSESPAPAPSAPTPLTAAPTPPAPTPAAVVAPAPVHTTTPSASVPKDLADRVKRGLDAASDNKPEIAVGMYQAAASKYGADHPALLPLKRSLTSRGPARIRELVAARRCAQAQALFRAMRSAGLAPAPAALFGGTCPAPN